jgi:MarR family transcriptional regulator, lower aerobic nicotinate degradation pathway regulator
MPLADPVAQQEPRPMRKSKALAARLEDQPGFYIRRLQQIAVALFLEETHALGITPVQYGALYSAWCQPGLDQRSLAASIGLDTSTLGGVIDRLERRGLIVRQASPDDRRVRLLHVTPEGEALLDAAVPAMLKAQARIVAPLPQGDRARFLDMLKTVVEANNDLSRAPSDA